MVLEGGYGGLLGLYYLPSVTAGLSATLEATGLRLHARPAPALRIKNEALQGDGTGVAFWPLPLTPLVGPGADSANRSLYCFPVGQRGRSSSSSRPSRRTQPTRAVKDTKPIGSP